MAQREDTSPGIRIAPPATNGKLDEEAAKQVEALERAIIGRLWGIVPGWAKWMAGLLLAGGGTGVAVGQYIPFEFKPWWARPAEVVAEATAREAGDKALQAQLDTIKAGLGQTMLETLRAFDKEKAAARRRGQR